MPNIVWVGNPFFVHKLKRPGLKLRFIACNAGELVEWDEISRDGRPDLVVVADKSLPPFVLGMENFPCLTALYIIDSHIHSWFPYYAQGFDLCMVSLKDHLPMFYGSGESRRGRVSWLPAYCGQTVSPQEAAAHQKLWDLLFVGTVNPQINPERAHWLSRFKALEPRLHISSGSYHTVPLSGRLILNHSIANDLNFRVFETLGCGLPLLSPRVGHGLEELFTDNEDLFLFDQADIPSAAAKASQLLAQPQKLAQVAQSGYEKVKKHHTAEHRANDFLNIVMDYLTSGQAANLIKERLAKAGQIRQEYLRLIYLLHAENMPEFPNMQAAYLAAASKSD